METKKTRLHLDPDRELQITNWLQTYYKLITNWLQTDYKLITNWLQTDYKLFTINCNLLQFIPINIILFQFIPFYYKT